MHIASSPAPSTSSPRAPIDARRAVRSGPAAAAPEAAPPAAADAPAATLGDRLGHLGDATRHLAGAAGRLAVAPLMPAAAVGVGLLLGVAFGGVTVAATFLDSPASIVSTLPTAVYLGAAGTIGAVQHSLTDVVPQLIREAGSEAGAALASVGAAVTGARPAEDAPAA